MRSERAPARAAALLAIPILLLAAFEAVAGNGQVAEPVIVVRSPSSGVYDMRASIAIPAPPRAVWNVVTDYDHLADFMPHFEESRTISRGDDSVVVRQKGGSSFIVTRHIALTLVFHEFPPDSATFRMLEGSIERYAGVWRFEPLGSGGVDSTRLEYEVEVGKFHIPGLIFRHVMTRDMGEMMPAIAREVARRAATRAMSPRQGG